MDDLFMNASEEEVVQPQEETQENSGEVVSPLDMSDEEFKEYTEGLKSGTVALREESTSQEAPAKDDGANEKPFKTFDTEEDFQGFMNKAIGERLKGARADKEKFESYGKRAMSFYGGDSYDDAISRMLDDVEGQFAENAGKTREEFAEEQQLKMDAFAYRSEIEQARKQQEAIDAIHKEWSRETENLKKVVPGFTLEKAMENEEFKNLVLKEGMSLSAAYIRLTANRESVKQRPYVNEIGTSGGYVSSQGAKDYLQMDRDEFMASMNRIAGKRG